LKPDISVIIPVFNSEKTIRILMDSINAQTKQNVEYICVDDASTDRTQEILKEYASGNEAITVLRNESNQGDFISRINAVSHSHGRYVMFADSDDELFPDYCLTAFETIEREKADVVQFSTEISYTNGLSESGVITEPKTMSAMPLSKIEHEECLLKSECWNSRVYRNYLWNKIYNGKLVRRIFSSIKRERLISTDYYFNLLFSLHAKSYVGINDVLYRYNFGGGITAQKPLQLGEYEVYLTPAVFCGKLETILPDEEYYRYLMNNTRRHFINGALDRLCKWVKADDLSLAFDKTIQAWGFDNVMDAISVASVQKRSEMAELFKNIDCFKSKKVQQEKALTIASYYPKLTNGGVERTISKICSMFADCTDRDGNNKYNVIIITDDQNEKENNLPEYAYSQRVIRETVPFIADGECYHARSNAWKTLIEKYDIDVVINNVWANSAFFTDALCIKGHEKHPFLVNHFHSFSAEMYRFRNSLAQYLTRFFSFSDGIVVMSETDERFVNAFNGCVTCIPNPLTFEPQPNDYEYEEKTILWAGRFANDKQPLEAVLTMSEIVSYVPEAKLYMVGSGNQDIEQQVQQLINNLNLNNNVELCGYSENIEDYYKRSAVLTLTSSTESFGLTLYEAASFGIPVVMYDLPWLTIVRDGRGIVTVPQRDRNKLALETVKLLQDREYRKRQSDLIKDLARDAANENLLLKWEDFLHKVISEEKVNTKNIDENILLNMITTRQNASKLSWQKENEKEKANANSYFRKMEESNNKADYFQEAATNNWQKRTEAIELANRMQSEAAANWEARNKALEQAANNWDARNKALEQAAANWQAREDAQKKQEYAWQKRTEAIELANRMQSEAAANWEARNKALEQAANNWKKRTEAIEEKRDIQQAKRELDKSFRELEKQFAELEQTHTELENDHVVLREHDLELQVKLEELQKNYDDLETQLITLAKKYKELTEHWSYKLFGKKDN